MARNSAPAMPLADVLDTFNGLPTHALLVHFTVVVATGGALGGLAYAVVPRFRRWLGWPLAATGACSVLLGLVTPASGEALERRVGESALVERHAELGDQMGTILIVYGLVLVLTTLVVRWRRDASGAPVAPTAIDRLGGVPGTAPRAFPGQSQIAAGLTLLVLVLSVVSGVWIYRTGEAGARAVWHDAPSAPATAPRDGDDG